MLADDGVVGLAPSLFYPTIEKSLVDADGLFLPERKTTPVSPDHTFIIILNSHAESNNFFYERVQTQTERNLSNFLGYATKDNGVMYCGHHERRGNSPLWKCICILLTLLKLHHHYDNRSQPRLDQYQINFLSLLYRSYSIISDLRGLGSPLNLHNNQEPHLLPNGLRSSSDTMIRGNTKRCYGAWNSECRHVAHEDRK